jgi:hypothetical protein
MKSFHIRRVEEIRVTIGSPETGHGRLTKWGHSVLDLAKHVVKAMAAWWTFHR